MSSQPQGAALTAAHTETVSWLPVVQRRIRDSIIPPGVAENDGTYLTPDIARAASEFFAAAAPLLPGEPYLDSTYEGDLIAEFVTRRGRLTVIVAVDFVLLYAWERKQGPNWRRVRKGDSVAEAAAYLSGLIA